MKRYTEDERIIEAFLHNYQVTDISRETGLSKNTVYRLMRSVEFQQTIQERKDAILTSAVNKMRDYLLKDVELLQSIIENKATSPQVRVNAIQVLMNQLRDWMTTTEIVTRLTALQEEVEKNRI